MVSALLRNKFHVYTPETEFISYNLVRKCCVCGSIVQYNPTFHCFCNIIYHSNLGYLTGSKWTDFWMLWGVNTVCKDRPLFTPCLSHTHQLPVCCSAGRGPPRPSRQSWQCACQQVEVYGAGHWTGDCLPLLPANTTINIHITLAQINHKAHLADTFVWDAIDCVDIKMNVIKVHKKWNTLRHCDMCT